MRPTVHNKVFRDSCDKRAEEKLKEWKHENPDVEIVRMVIDDRKIIVKWTEE